MTISKDDFENILQERFPNAKFNLIDFMGDSNHYSLEITSKEFEGLSLLNSHRLINERLKDCLGKEVHALTIKSINII